jgi:ABC-type transport system involved in cytochrome c biogenesis permease subunit
MIWARYAWGLWWASDIRLTTFLILWLLYISYRMLRRSAEAGSTSVMAAAMAVIVLIDVPAGDSRRSPRMKFALMTSILPFPHLPL